MSPAAGSHWLGPMMPSARAPRSSPNAARRRRRAPARSSPEEGPLPRDGQVVLERADAHDQIRVPRGRLAAECTRVEERRLERHNPHVDGAGGPRAFGCAAGDLAGEGPGRGVQNRHPIHHRNAASPPCGERPQIVAGRTRHAHHWPRTRLENGVRRAAVVPEHLPRSVRDGGDRAHQPAGVGPTRTSTWCSASRRRAWACATLVRLSSSRTIRRGAGRGPARLAYSTQSWSPRSACSPCRRKRPLRESDMPTSIALHAGGARARRGSRWSRAG